MLVSDVVKQKKANSKRFKIKRAPVQLYPRSIERQYNNFLLDYVRRYKELLKENLYPSLKDFEDEYTTDSYADETRDITGQIEDTLAIEYSDNILNRITYSTAFAVNKFNGKQVRKVLRKMVGVDIFLDDDNLSRAMEPFVVENVDLIKTIPKEYSKRVRNVIATGARNGYTSDTVSKLLEKQFKITKNRANLIASDQIGKFNGQLTKIRYTRVGITEYKWKTSLDERVRGTPGGTWPNARPSHYIREDKKFNYENPPSDGNPGEPIRCRCWAEPVIEL